jgi:hypothetical protein
MEVRREGNYRSNKRRTNITKTNKPRGMFTQEMTKERQDNQTVKGRVDNEKDLTTQYPNNDHTR